MYSVHVLKTFGSYGTAEPVHLTKHITNVLSTWLNITSLSKIVLKLPAQIWTADSCTWFMSSPICVWWDAFKKNINGINLSKTPTPNSWPGPSTVPLFPYQPMSVQRAFFCDAIVTQMDFMNGLQESLQGKIVQSPKGVKNIRVFRGGGWVGKEFEVNMDGATKKSQESSNKLQWYQETDWNILESYHTGTVLECYGIIVSPRR